MPKSGLLDSLGLAAPDKKTDKKPKGLDDAELAKALKSLPADPPKRAEALADLASRITEKTRRDPIVKALRDTIAKIQPIMSDADAKKKFDKALGDLVEKGLKDGLMELLKAAVGKAPSKVDRDAPREDGPLLPKRDPKEQIFKTPELPLPFDQPPKLKVHRFRIEAPKRVPPSKYFDFTLTTPDGFKPDDAKTGAAWVLIATKDDYDKNGGRPTIGRGVHIEKAGRQTLSHAGPDEPGPYVIFVKVGPGNEDSSAEALEVR